MLKPRKTWILLIVPALLIGVLAIGPGDDAEAATTHTVTIPAAAFTPSNHEAEFYNEGSQLEAYERLFKGYLFKAVRKVEDIIPDHSPTGA